VIGRVLLGAAGRRRARPLFERLHALTLTGLNFGNDDRATNGEEWVLGQLAQRLGPNPVVLDVGANRGEYAERLLEVFPATTHLHCLEPSRVARVALERRFAEDPRVTVHGIGLGGAEGSFPLYGDEPGSKLGSLHRRQKLEIPSEEVERVAITRLDAFCACTGIDEIAFLKIDAEGSEAAVLEGAGAMLDPTAIRAIQFEFGGTALDSRIYLRDFYELLSPRYRLYRLLRDGLAPLGPYAPELEIFVYANYLALPSES
jgi:FkbM family methyltransferase